MPDELPEPADPAPLPDERMEAMHANERMAAALATLPVRQREALVLQYYQELSNAETAALMGTSVEALESLLVRARRSLRAALADAARPGSGHRGAAPKEHR
jgi:RNA polymerase sigma-70 factor (ECF subfamily)